MQNPSTFIDRSDTKKGFAGFLDIMYCQKKLPWSLGAKILYKFGLLLFYFTSFIYPVIVLAIEQKHAGYNIVCGLISLISFSFELYDIIPDLYRYIKQWKEKCYKLKEEEDKQAVVEANTEDGSSRQQQVDKETSCDKDKEEEEINYTKKAKCVFKEFVLESFGEILVYPSIICSLYGFVNEKGWQFNNAIAVFDFLLLLYSIAMDIVYAKVYYIWLLQKVIRISYKAYDEYEKSC